MSDVTNKLNQILTARPEDRYPHYESLIHATITTNQPAALHTITDHLIDKEGNEQYGRTYIVQELVSYMVTVLADEQHQLTDPIDVDTMIPLLTHIIERLKHTEYVDALFLATDLLAKCYQANGNFKAAAVTLSSYKPDDRCTATTAQKMNYHLSTCEYFLECDDSGMAATALKRAQVLLNDCKDDSVLVLRYKTAYARVADLERRFLDAANRFVELSNATDTIVTDEDRLQSLEYAVRCSILAKAGPQRTAILARLCSDPRARQLGNYILLEKMYRQRVIRPDEVAKFEATLSEHQNAATATGQTVLQNSVMEHNILAVAKMYQNITFDQLGKLLGVGVYQAEQQVCAMIDTNRLDAVCSQITQSVTFQNNSVQLIGTGDASSGAPNEKLKNATGVTNKVIQQWDTQIQQICYAVDRVARNITTPPTHQPAQQSTAMT